MATPENKGIKMVQILSSPWHGDKGLTASIYGLDENGGVWRYSSSKGGWTHLSMRQARYGKRPEGEDDGTF